MPLLVPVIRTLAIDGLLLQIAFDASGHYPATRVPSATHFRRRGRSLRSVYPSFDVGEHHDEPEIRAPVIDIHSIWVGVPCFAGTATSAVRGDGASGGASRIS